jgi:hypothetical protein
MEKHFVSNSRLRKGEMQCHFTEISNILIITGRLSEAKIVKKCFSIKGNKGNKTWSSAG